MTPIKILAPILLIVVIITYFSSYTINEGQRGLTLKFGKIEMNAATGKPIIKNPGLHFKIPFYDAVKIFDARLQTGEVSSLDVTTSDQQNAVISYYFKWRVVDPMLYYTRANGDNHQAATLLEQQLDDILCAEFSQQSLSELVADNRPDVVVSLQQQASDNAKRLGLQLVDLRIKQISLPTEMLQAVYTRMNAERERIATERRAQGQASAEAIRADADAKAAIILATAKADAAKIRGDGDAQAANIYDTAYGKDPDFYSFYRSLEAYKNVFSDKSSIIVIRPDSQFFKYFNGDQGTPAAVAKK